MLCDDIVNHIRRVKIEVKVILGSAYFVSRPFYLVDLFFQGRFR